MVASERIVVVGAGIHGLSTAWHLAELRGSTVDITVLDKSRPGSGATGVACGVVRNYYVQRPMGALMARSVEIWERHAELLGYHPVGYLAAAPEVMVDDLGQIHNRHTSLGYPAELVVGAKDVDIYMKQIFEDWRATGIAAVLHEKKGGFAFASKAVQGMAERVDDLGIGLQTGVQVVGINWAGSKVESVTTNRGKIECDTLVVALGPWIGRLSDELGFPQEVQVFREGVQHAVPMWNYQYLQEGFAKFEVDLYTTASGAVPPVIHVDSDEPLFSDTDGRLLTDEIWGIYFKRDHSGVQGGSVPVDLGPDVEVDPYGPKTKRYSVSPGFAEFWTSGLAHCFSRFQGISGSYVPGPTGGIGAFSPDGFPIFDWLAENLYVIADSNHGFKMIGVGSEVAEEISGHRSEILEPFNLGRYAQGELFPTSASPYPWI